jgi:AhpC/TSA family
VIAGTFALAAIAVAISLFNFLLILGVVRRMRSMGPIIPDEYLEVKSGPPPGAQLPNFTARTTDGLPTDRSAFNAGHGLLAFLSVGCGACSEQLPQLRAYLAKRKVDPGRLLVVVSGDLTGESAYAAAAAAFATVVAEDADGPLTKLFDIKAFPTVLSVRDGRVQANAPSVAALHLEAARTPARN